MITDAKDYGLILGKNGRLYDTKKGQSLPEGAALYVANSMAIREVERWLGPILNYTPSQSGD